MSNLTTSLLLTSSDQSAVIVDRTDVDLVKNAGRWLSYKGGYQLKDKYDSYGRCITVDRLIMSQQQELGKLDIVEHLNGNIRDCRRCNMRIRQKVVQQPIGGETKEKITAKIYQSDAIWLESLPGNVSQHVRQAVREYKKNHGDD
jgi:hypothetical protein